MGIYCGEERMEWLRVSHRSLVNIGGIHLLQWLDMSLFKQYFTTPPYSIWNPYGIDIFHGFHMDSIWNMSIPYESSVYHMIIPYGFHAHSTWIPCSFHMDSMLIPSGMIPHGFHMDSIRFTVKLIIFIIILQIIIYK